MWNAASADVKKTYGKKYFYLPYDDYVNEGNNLSLSASSPELVLDAMEDALINVHPKPRYIVGGSGGMYDPYAVSLLSPYKITSSKKNLKIPKGGNQNP